MAKYTAGYSSNTINEFSKRTLAKELPEILKYLKPNMSVLDVGCGPGSLTREVADILVDGGEITGIDINDNQFPEIEDRKNITFIKSNFLEEFDEVGFDLIYMHAVLYHLSEDNIKKAITKAKKILKKDGIIIIRDNCIELDTIIPEINKYQDLKKETIDVFLENEASPNFGKKQTEILANAGFSILEHNLSSDIFSNYIIDSYESNSFSLFWLEYCELNSDLFNRAGVDSKKYKESWNKWGEEDRSLYHRTRFTCVAKA